jgi:hypothetical protein
VRDHDEHRAGLARHALQQLPHRSGVFRIEVPRRLVAQQQRRPVHQRPRNRDALPLAAGEFAGQVRRPAAQSDVLEQFVGSIRVVVRHLAAGELRQQDVFGGGALREQVVVLKDESDPRAAELGEQARIERERVDPVKRDGAARRPVERAEDVEQRALARAARPDDRQRLARN